MRHSFHVARALTLIVSHLIVDFVYYEEFSHTHTREREREREREK